MPLQLSYAMSQKDSFDWVYILLMFSVVGWWSVVQIRYLLKRSRSNRWPTVDATIQRGAIGNISFGRGGSAPASFMGYAYIVQGARYAGYFAVYGEEVRVRKLHEGLAGRTIEVRYEPSNPDNSCLANSQNSLFGGLTATQNPEWLDQSPAFDLQDALR
jgi:hypothetical protein